MQQMGDMMKFKIAVCDEILVFDQGRVVQHGGYEQLVEDKQGKYYVEK